jgi:hypothetical protein
MPCWSNNCHRFLLLTNNPFLEASIQCAVFKGTGRTVFLDRKEYHGPLFEEIDEAYSYVLRNIRLGAEINGLYRKDIYELPISSVRELIANGVSHRSYLDPSKMQVAIFDDRLEVTSPGMLIGGLTMHPFRHRGKPSNMGAPSSDDLDSVYTGHLGESVILITDASTATRKYAEDKELPIIQLKSKTESIQGKHILQKVNKLHYAFKQDLARFYGVSTK